MQVYTATNYPGTPLAVAIEPTGHCSTCSRRALVLSCGQLRPFSNAIRAPALMILSRAKPRWVSSSSRRRAATAAPALEPARRILGLCDVVVLEEGAYDILLDHEQAAIAAGYPDLA